MGIVKKKKKAAAMNNESRCSSSPDWRHYLRPKRKVLKFAKRTKPNTNNNNNADDPFHNSDGSSWSRRELLGKGAFGSVFVAQIINPESLPSPYSNHHFAVKSSLLERSSLLQFEKKVLDDLNSCSNNVIQCYGEEVTVNESGKQVYNLLLEYCFAGDLHDFITRFKPNGLPELKVRRLTRDIVCGLASIHGRGYIHCDIKPENILLVPSSDDRGRDRFVAKIADFGLAMEMSKVGTIDEEDGIRGTTPYLAPELVTDNYPDWPIDIWALGCVVLEMLTGRGAWGSKARDSDLFTHIGYGNELPEIPSGLSAMANDFLRRCLIRNPCKRSSAWSLIDHPFICDS